jgi:hypothetical protein
LGIGGAYTAKAFDRYAASTPARESSTGPLAIRFQKRKANIPEDDVKKTPAAVKAEVSDDVIFRQCTAMDKRVKASRETCER